MDAPLHRVSPLTSAAAGTRQTIMPSTADGARTRLRHAELRDEEEDILLHAECSCDFPFKGKKKETHQPDTNAVLHMFKRTFVQM